MVLNLPNIVTKLDLVMPLYGDRTLCTPFPKTSAIGTQLFTVVSSLLYIVIYPELVTQSIDVSPCVIPGPKTQERNATQNGKQPLGRGNSL